MPLGQLRLCTTTVTGMERRPPEPKATGSNPVGRANLSGPFLQQNRAILLRVLLAMLPEAAASHRVRRGPTSPQDPRSAHQELAEKLAPPSADPLGPCRPVRRPPEPAHLRPPGPLLRGQARGRRDISLLRAGGTVSPADHQRDAGRIQPPRGRNTLRRGRDRRIPLAPQARAST